ncbi:hypothetical protein POM88_003955 [Heracleum sosnowskyi]|uniref:H15 domain-containing protein n=1 Tax=Heracleum sosnowskyi TaxID=360622 RepID=A0AAD8JLV1_9APIA|nr:hypothetical protein POM88_003955 [Heracleum sosnowskyi]
MEYSASDPPPLSFAPPSNYPSPPFSFSQPAANLPTHPQLQLNHPPYEEMIRRAVMALNEKEGSSRQKISRYIENEFHVPKSTLHEFELTQHLRQMKNFGQLVLVRHSYMLPLAPPPQPQTHSSPRPSVGPFVPPAVQPSVGPSLQPSLGPSVQPYIGPSVAPSPISDGHKRKPGRPPKLQPVVVSPTPTPSPPVGFAAFSPKQSGVPTTSLFGGLAPASYQFSSGPSVSAMGLVTGSSNYASTLVPVSSPANGVPTMTIASGPVTIVPSVGPVSNVSLSSPVPVNNVHAIVGGHMANLPGLVGVSVNNVPTTSPVSGPGSYSGPVFDPVALVKVGTSEQINESAGVVGTGLGSSAGPLVISAANDPADGSLLVVPTGPDLIAPDGPSTVLGKRGRGRPPKINGGIKKLWGKPGSYGRRGRRGRPKKVTVPVSTISLRPRGRPRKNTFGAVVADTIGAIVAVDGANGGGGAFPVANIPLELPDRSFGHPNKDVPDAASLTSEIHLMAYQGLKAKIEHLHARIKSAVSVIRPRLNETEVRALGALQDLEDLTNMDILSVPVNAQSAPAYVQSAPVDDLNPLVNVQGAPVADLNAPVNVQDAATENIPGAPSTAEDAHLTLQGTPSDAETAQLTFQSSAVPVQGQQEPPLQS